MKTPAVIAALLASLAAPLSAESGPAKNVSPDEAAKMLAKRKDIVVLDLRTETEFKAGHIAGAKNIDFLADDFAQKVGALDKSKTYLVHCAGGGRSTRALDVFNAQKFASILHLNEGFKAWVAAGQPVEK
jgi:rhodanese-related sulfurtransferase